MTLRSYKFIRLTSELHKAHPHLHLPLAIDAGLQQKVEEDRAVVRRVVLRDELGAGHGPRIKILNLILNLFFLIWGECE